jgi:hypothetical protein
VRFVTGDFAQLFAVVATQAKQWLDTGSNTLLEVTPPDNSLVSGYLANGAIASSHVGHIPFAGSGRGRPLWRGFRSGRQKGVNRAGFAG